jgi:hypothetical protein
MPLPEGERSVRWLVVVDRLARRADSGPLLNDGDWVSEHHDLGRAVSGANELAPGRDSGGSEVGCRPGRCRLGHHAYGFVHALAVEHSGVEGCGVTYRRFDDIEKSFASR